MQIVCESIWFLQLFFQPLRKTLGHSYNISNDNFRNEISMFTGGNG